MWFKRGVKTSRWDIIEAKVGLKSVERSNW